MKGAILLFEQFQGKKNIGSSRIRGHWIVKNWKKAGPDIGELEIFQLGKKYDYVIFQKAYWIDYMKDFKGLKILDLCDPDWMDWGARIVECINYCDLVTVSSPALRDYLRTITDKEIYLIEDRIDFETLPPPKKHKNRATKVVWYGYNHNFPTLESAIMAIARCKLDLIVISNKPYIPNSVYGSKIDIQNYPWSEATVNADIQRGDMVINPQFGHGTWRFKSNNKTTLAWALGLPVAETEKEMKRLIEPEVRSQQAMEDYVKASDNYKIEKSVEELKTLIQKYTGLKNEN